MRGGGGSWSISPPKIKLKFSPTKSHEYYLLERVGRIALCRWRRDGRTKPSRTPAPNKYSLGTTIGNGAPDMPSAPMYSIQGRRDRPAGRRVASHASPGPARYSAVPLEKTLPQPPRPVMFGRHEDGLQRRRRGTPGPNAYQPGAASLSSRYPSAPQFSIAGRFPPSSMVYTTEDLAPDWDC